MDDERYEEMVRVYGLELGVVAFVIVASCFVCKFGFCCCKK